MFLPNLVSFVNRRGTSSPGRGVGPSVRTMSDAQQAQYFGSAWYTDDEISRALCGPNRYACIGTGLKTKQYDCCDRRENCLRDDTGGPFCRQAQQKEIGAVTDLPDVLSKIVADYAS